MRLFLILALLTAGCVAGDRERPAPSAQICGPGSGSAMFPDRFYFLDFGSRVFRQGATIAITPRADNSPAGQRDLPLDCTSDWSIRGPATLAADHRSITIAPDAPPGSDVEVTLRYGPEQIRASVRVIGREAIVLTGTYNQRSIERCETSDPVRELVFSPDGRFSVTFQPFETYKDYWGTYAYDPDSRRLVMTVAGGNSIPFGLDLDGSARIAEGRLVLEQIYLGSRGGQPAHLPAGSSAAPCRYTF